MSYSGGGGGTSLSASTDVALNTPTNGQVLTFDTSLGKWKNAIGGTSAVNSVAGKSGTVTLVAGDVSGVLAASNNLSDVATPATARTNLGLGTAATQASTAFDAAGAATTAQAASLQKTSNLSDLSSASTSRTNLGLGNVDNTSDANKPVSSATQTALNGKVSALGTVRIWPADTVFPSSGMQEGDLFPYIGT